MTGNELINAKRKLVAMALDTWDEDDAGVVGSAHARMPAALGMLLESEVTELTISLALTVAGMLRLWAEMDGITVEEAVARTFAPLQDESPTLDR